MERFSAAAAFGGYLFQIERALCRLLDPACSSGMAVGVETLDDITVYDPSGQPILLEQDKSTQTTITDGSVELWKALRIWAIATKDRQVDPRTTELWLVCRNEVSSGLALRMAAANTDDAASAAADQLRAYRHTAPASVTPFVHEVVTLPPEDLSALVKAFRLQQAQSAKGLSRSIQQLLKLNRLYVDLPDTTVDEIAQALWGYVTKSVAEALGDHRPAIIARDLVARIELAELDRHRTHRALEAAYRLVVTPDEIENHLGSMFVQQLRAVACEEESILEAITDLIRCQIDRVRWSQLAEVSRDDLGTFDRNLKARWRGVRMEALAHAATLDEPAIGRTILGRVLQHREPLAGHPTEHQYTTSGRYHQLADLIDVWWHPRFSELVPVLAGSVYGGT